MSISPNQQSHLKINQLINSSRLNESFSLIKNIIGKYDSLFHERDKVSELETTYKYLLHFMSEGHDDPSRQQMLNEIRDGLYKINDLVFRTSLLSDSADSYSTAKRLELLKKSSFNVKKIELVDALNNSSGQEKTESECMTYDQVQAINSLFNYVWTIFGAEPAEYQAISEALIGDDLPDYVKASLLSALLLGNTSFFDSEALNVLLDVYDSPVNPLIKVRALVAIFIIILIHSERILLNSNLKSRILLMKEDPDMKELFNDLLIDLIRTYDTERVSTKMREELIPGLMKIKPDIIDKMRNLASDSEDYLSEINPQWEDLIEESGIKDKLQEINDMQMEGADVMMTTFSNLKTFPFFNQISNWFLPFICNHPEINSLEPNNAETSISRLKIAMCDSDIYSFMLSMKSLPDSNRQMMLKNMSQQIKQAEEVLTSAVGETEKTMLSREIKHYLQDIYRFFKLYRKKDDFKDPFINAASGKMIGSAMEIIGLKSSSIRLAAEFYFKYKYFKEAASMFELLNELESDDFGIWEKIGYCYDRLQQYQNALDWYKKSEIINPDNLWLQKKIAICLKNNGDFINALLYYDKALIQDPENYHLLISSGQCLLEAGEYEKALQNFYHAEYLKPERKDSKRAIAWTLLLSKEYEKAEKKYDQLINMQEAEKSDLMNAAMCAMANNKIPVALKIYSSYLKLINNNFNVMMTDLRDDAAVLKKLGISSASLRLVIDKLRYDLSDPD